MTGASLMLEALRTSAGRSVTDWVSERGPPAAKTQRASRRGQRMRATVRTGSEMDSAAGQAHFLRLLLPAFSQLHRHLAWPRCDVTRLEA